MASKLDEKRNGNGYFEKYIELKGGQIYERIITLIFPEKDLKEKRTCQKLIKIKWSKHLVKVWQR